MPQCSCFDVESSSRVYYNWLLLRASNMTRFGWRLWCQSKRRTRESCSKRLIPFSRLLPYILLMLPSRIHFYFLPTFRIVRRVLLFMLPRNKRARGFLTLAPFKMCSLSPVLCQSQRKDNRWTQGDPKLGRAAPLFPEKEGKYPFLIKNKSPGATSWHWALETQIPSTHQSTQ